jgi:hypothetical protein
MHFLSTKTSAIEQYIITQSNLLGIISKKSPLFESANLMSKKVPVILGLNLIGPFLEHGWLTALRAQRFGKAKVNNK